MPVLSPCRMFAFCTHQKNAGRIFLVQAWKHSSVIEKNFHCNNFKSRCDNYSGIFYEYPYRPNGSSKTVPSAYSIRLA